MNLYDAAKVLRSKNSGPFQITLDILFDNEERYQKVKGSGIISRETISRLYRLPLNDVLEPVCYDNALGIKVTYNRPVSSGTAGDRDVYGAQQHGPLMELEIPD